MAAAVVDVKTGLIDQGKTKERQFVEGLVSTKDIIAPGALEVETDFIKIGTKFYRTLFTVINRRFVEINWLSTLINFDASLTVAMYIYPSDGKEILDDLRRKITEMEAELTTDIQRGRIVNPATQAKLEDALNLQADLVKGEERFFQMGLYITVSAESKEQMDKVTKNLEAAMGALMVLTKRTTFDAENAFITTLPLGSDRLNLTRNMDTTSLATTFPFVSSDLSDDKGIMFGINEHNGSLVIFDRFSMQNYNSVVFATAGAGKSYMIKLEALRSLMMGTDIIVIDPENEYKDLCEAAGGQYIAFGYGEASKINPFDLSLIVDEGDNALNAKILGVHKLLKVMLGELDPIEESILDRAVVDAYKMKGITPDPETQSKEPPLVEDLYKSLIGMEDKQAQMIAARLEKYIKGSFAGIFNQKTTVNLKSEFVVFGIKNLEDTLRPVAMHIILDYIWTVVKKEMRRRILVVDEAWYLMQYPDSAAFLRGIVKRGRKYYLGVTTITQDVDDFLETAYGREIVTNSAIQILLKQHSAAIDQIGEVFYLSEGEKQLLLSADKGEGIFFAGQNHVAIRVVASEDEHKLITSNPEEVMKMKQQLKLQRAKEAEDRRVEREAMGPLGTSDIIKQMGKTEEPLVKTTEPELVLTKPPETLEKTVVQSPIMVTEVVGDTKPEEELQKRIAEMEAVEKEKVEEHKKKVAAEAEVLAKEEVEKKKLQGTLGGFGTLPKYQDLFVNKNKLPPLPPLPPLPKFQPSTAPSASSGLNSAPAPVAPTTLPKSPQFATEVVSNTGKPTFVNLPKEEVKVPQPPQLSKKPQPVFENQTMPQPVSTQPSTAATMPTDKPKDNQNNAPGMDYDKLFGNV
ncbi:ATP-binding protein [Candidatus Shapirobacteria bacterium]|nr:ATP-binding protein [Candidatus Shapirobacteria bacterium]